MKKKSAALALDVGRSSAALADAGSASSGAVESVVSTSAAAEVALCSGSAVVSVVATGASVDGTVCVISRVPGGVTTVKRTFQSPGPGKCERGGVAAVVVGGFHRHRAEAFPGGALGDDRGGGVCCGVAVVVPHGSNDVVDRRALDGL